MKDSLDKNFLKNVDFKKVESKINNLPGKNEMPSEGVITLENHSRLMGAFYEWKEKAENLSK